MSASGSEATTGMTQGNAGTQGQMGVMTQGNAGTQGQMGAPPGLPDIKQEITPMLNRVDQLISDPGIPKLGERIGATLGKVVTPILEGAMGDNKNSDEWERRNWHRRDDPSGPRPSGAHEAHGRKRGGPLRMMAASIGAIQDVRDMVQQLKTALIDPTVERSGQPAKEVRPGKKGMGMGQRGGLSTFKGPKGMKPAPSVQVKTTPSALSRVITSLTNTEASVANLASINTTLTDLVTAYKTVNADAIAAAEQATANAPAENAEPNANENQEGGRRRRRHTKRVKRRRGRATRR